MQIELVTSAQAFDALEADWRALEARSVRGSVFLGWDWQRLWWTHYGSGRQLRILVARVHDTVVGLLPLYLEHHRVARILRVRKLRPIGAGGDTSPDDLGILSEPSCELAVARAFVHHIMTSPERWHLLDLVDLPSDSALVDCLARQAAQQRDVEQRRVAASDGARLPAREGPGQRRERDQDEQRQAGPALEADQGVEDRQHGEPEE